MLRKEKGEENQTEGGIKKEKKTNIKHMQLLLTQTCTVKCLLL